MWCLGVPAPCSTSTCIKIRVPSKTVSTDPSTWATLWSWTQQKAMSVPCGYGEWERCAFLRSFWTFFTVIHLCMHAQLCPALWDPMDGSPPVSSVHGLLQAGILEWVAISFSKGSSNTEMESTSLALARGFFTTKPPGRPILYNTGCSHRWNCRPMAQRSHRTE